MKRKLRKLLTFATITAMVSGNASFAFAQASFIDISENAYAQVLQRAAERGLISGYATRNGRVFMPDAPITRAEMATILNKALGTTQKSDLSAYNDVPSNAWYAEQVQKALAMGTLEGKDGKVRPNDFATVEEVIFAVTKAFSTLSEGAAKEIVGSANIEGFSGTLDLSKNVTRAEFVVAVDFLASGYNAADNGKSVVAVVEDLNPLIVSRTGYKLEDYTLNLKVDNAAEVKETLVFYSTVGLVDIEDELGELSDAKISELKAAGKLLTAGTGADITVKLPANLVALDGHKFNPDEKDKIYYIYAVSLNDKNEAVGVYKADKMIHPERGPQALASIGAGAGTGAVVPGGGATSVYLESKTYAQAYVDAFKQNTPGITPRIAIFSASWEPTEAEMYDDFYNDSDKEAFAEIGCEAVYIPTTLDNYKSISNEQYFADLVESCHIVFFFGGAQLNHSRSLVNDDGSLSKVGQAIHNVYSRGGTIAGSSAGAAFMSRFSYSDGSDYSYQSMYWNQAEFIDFAKFDAETQKEPVAKNIGNSIYFDSVNVIQPVAGVDALMDSHFDMRGRLGRLLVAIRDTNPKGMALALDEGTIMRITNKVGTVAGHNGVFVIDAKDAVWGAGTGPANPFSVTGVKVHYLTEGDTFDFATGTVTPAAGKTQISAPAGEVYKTNHAFGPYETTKTIISLANSSASSVTVKGKKAPDVTFTDGPTFDVTYTKNGSTKAYTSTLKYEEAASKELLDGYAKTTITNLNLDIKKGNDLPIIKGIVNDATSATITLNNPVSVNGKTSGAVDLGADISKYVSIKDKDGAVKEVVGNKIEFVSEKVLKVALKAGSFAEGDTIQLLETVKDVYGEALNSEIVFRFDGSKWSCPLKVTEVYNSSSKPYRLFIEFSNEIASGFTDSRDDKYFIDPTLSAEEKAKYIVVKNSSGKVKDLDSSNSFYLDPEYPKEIMIDLDSEDIETGDTITIKKPIKDIYGEGLVEDLTFKFDGSDWKVVAQ